MPRPSEFTQGVIYTLSCPVTGSVRYVGQTRNYPRRLSQHCSPFCNKGSTHRERWLRSLLLNGMKPICEIIETCDDMDASERYWISKFKAEGADLVNGNDGGSDNSHMQRAPRSNKTRGKRSKLAVALQTIKSVLPKRYEQLAVVLDKARREGRYHLIEEEFERRRG